MAAPPPDKMYTVPGRNQDLVHGDSLHMDFEEREVLDMLTGFMKECESRPENWAPNTPDGSVALRAEGGVPSSGKRKRKENGWIKSLARRKAVQEKTSCDTAP